MKETPMSENTTDNPFLVDTELRREPGNSRDLTTTITLEEPLGTEVIGIPAGAPVHLDLLLESVMDGILVSGTIEGTLVGECVRCLAPLEEELSVDVTELYSYPEALEGQEWEEDEEPLQVVDDQIDLTELVVDAVVADLPFKPLCASDCPGLCPECGVPMAENPGHEHEAPIDSRWAALAELAGNDGE